MTRTILALTATLLSTTAFAGAGTSLGIFAGEVEHVRNTTVRVTEVEFEIFDNGDVLFLNSQTSGTWTDYGRVEDGLRSMVIETADVEVEGTFDRQTGCFEGTGLKLRDNTTFVMSACKIQT